MKWLPGDSPYWQYLAEDSRYRVAKTKHGDAWHYTAWVTHGTGCTQLTEPRNTDVSVARKAAEAHYAAMQRKAA